MKNNVEASCNYNVPNKTQYHQFVSLTQIRRGQIKHLSLNIDDVSNFFDT